MEFLRGGSKRKIVRTRLYGDQEFSRFELELLHTPVLQRLYNLKQLGFTDKVYPDAVHARFNHILGATDVVDRMAHRLVTWLEANPDVTFAFVRSGGSPDTVTGAALGALLTERMPTVRLMALLHDVTHAAFGHTLEDEVNVFDEKHDDPSRQIRFFNALTAQLLYFWVTEERLREFDGSALQALANLEVSENSSEEIRWAQELAANLSDEQRKQLATLLRQLELAQRLLLNIEFAHGKHGPQAPALLVTQVAATINADVPVFDLELYRDIYMIDLVGNTICADLLDYARRDADQAGLRVQFDDRFLRYICVVSVEGELAPGSQRCIRTAIQIFTDKMRHDVLSEMSGVLKARYLISERVLFHPTKCAAGAMLGTAVQFLGLRDLPGWMQVLGDDEFLHVLNDLATHLAYLAARLKAEPPSNWREVVRVSWPADIRTASLVELAVCWILPSAADEDAKTLSSDDVLSLRIRANAARNVMSRLTARRFAKLVYRLRAAQHSGGETDETLANDYSKPVKRYELEREVERICNLPAGAVSVHCPNRKTSMKVAEVLVVGSNLDLVARLAEVTKVSPEGLEPYQREINAIQDMYKSIWSLNAFLDPAHWEKWPVVAWTLERLLHFPSDKLLSDELAKDASGPYWLISGELKDEIAPMLLGEVVRGIDSDKSLRMRFGSEDLDPQERLREIIRKATPTGSGAPEQLGLPGVGSR
jgi:HD superfamily phosphohydrolase